MKPKQKQTKNQNAVDNQGKKWSQFFPQQKSQAVGKCISNAGELVVEKPGNSQSAPHLAQTTCDIAATLAGWP